MAACGRPPYTDGFRVCLRHDISGTCCGGGTVHWIPSQCDCKALRIYRGGFVGCTLLYLHAHVEGRRWSNSHSLVLRQFDLFGDTHLVRVAIIGNVGPLRDQWSDLYSQMGGRGELLEPSMTEGAEPTASGNGARALLFHVRRSCRAVLERYR